MKLLLTGAFKYSSSQIEYLKNMGFDITFIQDERIPIDSDVSDIDAVICNGLFLHTPIENFKNLKFVQLTSAGLNRVPLDYINQYNIKLCNARGVYSAPMAEFALCGVLDLYKKSRIFYENQKNHKWEKYRGLQELSGKNVLIIGAGDIGGAVAKRFKAFDTSVAGIDPYRKSSEAFDVIYSTENLDEQLTFADIVVLTLPLTDDNEGFFDGKKFALMKSTAVFVNIARGKLVNQNDLIDALASNQIAGAVLDVFDKEPLDDKSPLWDMNHVILTPHNSFEGELNNKRMFDLIKKNLEGFLNE